MTNLSALMHSVMAPYYRDGTLLVGGSTYPVKYQRDMVTEQSRNAPGFVSADAIILILQEGVPVAPNAESEITTDDGRVWAVNDTPQEDPGTSYWQCTCTELRRAAP